MHEDAPPGPVFRVGRAVLWLVLALLLAGVLYAGAMSAMNWTAIHV